MKDKILAALSRLHIDEYIINEERTRSAELFFIKKTLDTRRIKDYTDYAVTVYRSFDKDGTAMKGSSMVHIYDSQTDAEIDTALSGAYLAASFVCNPTYGLQEKDSNDFVEMKSDLQGKTLEESAKIMADALFAEDNGGQAFLNSAELFVNEITVHIWSSTGIDCGYRKYYVTGEFVAQCKEPQDVETYQSFRYYNLETQALKTKVRRTLDYTLARAQASKAPAAGNYRVIICDSYVKELFSYYTARSMAPYIFAGYSSFKLDENVQAKTADGKSREITGDTVSIRLMPDEPYSDEGTRMIERQLLDKGVLKTYHGGVRFSRYIGAEPTGDYRSIKVEPGSTSIEDMKKQPYLQVVNFSDFQMDNFTGHFGGEIRLAFLCDGEKVTPVTGGSINGSIIDAQSSLILSKETQIEGGYEGPLAVCFDNIPVAGE
ncbi:MAG: hypothetical protein K6G81_04175 [Lachnospiraceae bacterium]|nr:hypothetical protein [Lachnospiraceae bacterium]